MALYEFNNLDLEDKFNYVWNSPESGFKCYCVEGGYKYVLFDCGKFFAESCVRDGKTISIEGFELTDDRLNAYIDWMEEHKDDPKYQMF